MQLICTCFYGNLQLQIGSCYAEFEISDRVIAAKVFGDGSMKIRNATQSRQRIGLDGEPPQRDGFEPDLPGVLRGHFASEVGGDIYSKATGKWDR